MRKTLLCIITLFALTTFLYSKNETDLNYKQYDKIIRENIYKDYKKMYREAGGAFLFPFLTPGSDNYPDQLWDWDSWLSNIALRQILLDKGTEKDKKEAVIYEQGCILNFLSYCKSDGWMPVTLSRKPNIMSEKPKNINEVNMHKPCIAQHAAFLIKQDGENAEWLRDKFANLQYFVGAYKNRYYSKVTGLFLWQNDVMIGVDNDPCTYFRPDRSSASIYLNCLMYKELKAMSYLAERLDLKEIQKDYEKDATKLKEAIQEHCWDERDGFFYSVDLNLKPIDPTAFYHSGAPRDWDCLIQRIDVWSGFLAMWAGIATPEQAKRMILHYNNPKTFNAPFGVRTLSKMEKMYNVKASSNPSTWLGPIWGISNYMTWRGLVNYGYKKEAKELATKTIVMFGRDFEKTGVLHEYYQPDNGAPILNPGFQNWNFLVLNMLNWIDGKGVVEEF